MTQLLPQVNLLRCYKHMKDDLCKRHDGRTSLEIYDKLAGLPKVQNGRRVADTLYERLPASSPLRAIPKHQLAAVYLPHGACTHGMRTNNAAEVYNAMSLCARTQETLYRSLMATLQLFQDRRTRLFSSIPRRVAPMGGADDDDSSRAAVAEPPRVRDAYAKARGKASVIACPQVCDDPEDLQHQIFMVESTAGGALTPNASQMGSGFKWPVSISKFIKGDYEGACGCGRTACGISVCEHVMRVVMACRRADTMSFRKPWQSTNAWEVQVGPAWIVPRAQDVLEAVNVLRGAGELHVLSKDNPPLTPHPNPTPHSAHSSLHPTPHPTKSSPHPCLAGELHIWCEPILHLIDKGRPRNDMNAEASQRAKSFLEDIRSGLSEAEAQVHPPPLPLLTSPYLH